MRNLLRLLPFPMLIVLAACARSAGDPNNTILAEVAPPGGTMKAVIFERAGGPGGSTTTQVSVLPLGEPLPMGPGNVFISDASSAPGRGIKVKWAAAAELEISYPEGTGVYRNEEEHEGVKIAYEVREPSEPAATAPATPPGDTPAPTPTANATGDKTAAPAPTPAPAAAPAATPAPSSVAESSNASSQAPADAAQLLVEPIDLPPPPGSSAPATPGKD